MRLLQPFYCLFGNHHRSRGRAWNDGSFFRSWCEGCGKPMVRDVHGWHLDRTAENSASEAKLD
jgi:hypothetical protein